MSADTAIETPTPSRPVSLDLQREIEQFLYLEAELLDEKKLDAWYELLADDLEYMMPIQTAVYPAETKGVDPESAGYSGEYFADNKAGMGRRIRKALSGRDHIERPASNLRHMISNVRIRALDGNDGDTEDGTQLAVRSYFLVHRFRHGEFQDLYTGERQDVLVRGTKDGWKIRSRLILLDQTVLLGGGIGFFF